MLFKNNEMSIITDLNLLGNDINNFDLLTIAAITNDYPNHPNIYNASILVPPTELLMRWADNEPLVLENNYPLYLASKEADDMIIALLAALTKKNVILYIPNDEFSIYGPLLLNHIYYMYGITCNGPAPNFKFSIIPDKIPFILSKFYMIDVIEYEDYMASYPANALLPQFVIGKMATEINPFNRPASFEEYANYFNNINASKANNEVKNIMIKRVDKNDGSNR